MRKVLFRVRRIYDKQEPFLFKAVEIGVVDGGAVLLSLIHICSEDAAWLWNRLVELGAKPAGLGARDTLRLEAALPLYGHEMGLDPAGNEMPIFAVPLAKFAVSFAPQKGDFIGRKPLEQQFAAFKRIMNRDFSDLSVLPRRIQPITLLDRGVMRAGMPVYQMCIIDSRPAAHTKESAAMVT